MTKRTESGNEIFFIDPVNTIETHESGEDEQFKVFMLLDELHRLGHLERVVEAYTLCDRSAA